MLARSPGSERIRGWRSRKCRRERVGDGSGFGERVGDGSCLGESRSTASAEYLASLVREAARGAHNGKARAALRAKSPARPIDGGATRAAKVRRHGDDFVLRDGIRQIGRRSRPILPASGSSADHAAHPRQGIDREIVVYRIAGDG